MKKKSKAVEPKALTPKQQAVLFFEAVEKKNDQFILFSSELARKNSVPPERVRQELLKFAAYWTEPNGSGTKMRWQLQKVFEVRRRLATWFGHVGFQGFSAARSVGGGRGKEIIE